MQSHHPLRTRIATVTLATCLLGGAAFGMAHATAAQSDGTGADSAASSADCAIVRADALPSLATTEATPQEATAVPATERTTPISSPVSEAATPVAGIGASPAASPVADTEPLTPAEQVTNDVTTTISTLFACLNAREFDVYASMTGDTWRGAFFGIADPLSEADFIELASVLPTTDTTLASASNLQVIDETTVTVDVIYTVAHQQMAGTWTFALDRVEGLPAWVLQSAAPLDAKTPDGAESITVTMTGNGYSLIPGATNSPNVVLKLHNPTGEVHEALVLKLDDGITTDALLQSTSGSLPEGVTYIGQATLTAGASGDLSLVDLEPGTYTLVDLLPDENGVPHLSSGMEATFTVRP